MNALKGELRGKWLEELGILEKAQEMWTNALMNPEVDEFEEAVNNDDEIKFMYKGKNKEGIEVYSISSETKKIPRSEKRRSARKMINNAIVGKSVRFTTDEGSYEAKIGKDFASKNIYGDNQTKNKTALDKKINLLFENDTLQLLDGAKFDDNKLDRNNKHGHKILGWDYFKKEVIIGNVKYDLLINVEKTETGNYIYNVKFEKNKRTDIGRIAQAEASDWKSTDISSDGDNLSQKDNGSQDKKYQIKTDANGTPLSAEQSVKFQKIYLYLLLGNTNWRIINN